MRKILILIFTFIITTNFAQAYNIVLPREKKFVTQNDYAFFVGKINDAEEFSINGTRIPSAQNGAFAYSVKLKKGENRIVLRSLYKREIYKIFKEVSAKKGNSEVLEFNPALYRVKKDNEPLRSTPVDAGMNRLSHLFKNTNLMINGESGEFYRVYLTKNKSAWIAKKGVEPVAEKTEVPSFITMNSETFKNASVHTLEFTDKLPYTIEEKDKEIIFRVYNPYVSEESVYTVNIRKPSDKYFYKTILCNGVYRFKVTSIPVPETQTLESLNIVIDPGHGGTELGAVGCLGDNEKDINLNIAAELKDILTQMGANVFMTRECDANVSLDERIEFAKLNNANIFISIHLNSIPDICMNVHKNRGTSVYYYNKNSGELAKKIEKSLVSSLDTKKEGVKTASFAVIRPTEYVGVIVETAYMTNPLDSVIYKSENFARKSALAIAEGILNFVHSK